MDNELRSIQTAIGNWCENRIKTNIIPAILFAADGSVTLIHYTGETERMELEEILKKDR